MVSILMATYNHEDFVSDAIAGVLAQKASFPFELLIRDDASTDGTAEILTTYRDAYPGIIRTFLSPCREFPRVRSNYVLRPEASGKYIAYCEGDDYWIDSRKLACQIQELEGFGGEGRAFSLHQRVVIEDHRVVRGPEMGGEQTLVHPSDFKHDPRYFNRMFSYDVFLHEALSAQLQAIELDLVGAVYRRHSRGISTSLKIKGRQPELRVHQATTFFWLGTYFSEIGDQQRSDRNYAEAVAALMKWPGVRVGRVLRLVVSELTRRAFRKSVWTSRLLRGPRWTLGRLRQVKEGLASLPFGSR